MPERIYKKTPDVTVVLPAFNEISYIAPCLESLTLQDYEGNIQIIVVDNNSTDSTAKIAKCFGVKVVVEKNKGVAFARQAGFEAAKTEIIISTDADVIVPTNWVSMFVRAFEEHPEAVAVGGYVYLYDSPALNFLNKISHKLQVLEYSKYVFSGKKGMSTQNLAVKREAFNKVGGFDTSIKNPEALDDLELTLRLGELGETIVDKRIVNFASARRYKKAPVKTVTSRLRNYVSYSVGSGGRGKEENADFR